LPARRPIDAVAVFCQSLYQLLNNAYFMTIETSRTCRVAGGDFLDRYRGGEETYPAAGALRAPRLRRLAGLLVAAGLAAPALAQQGVFELGAVVVTGKSQAAEQTAERVLDSATIDALGKDTVGAAVAVLPGVSLSRNSRNEDMVSLRGFDARQVPLYIDGVPLYVPYDGYVDFGRFTTFDLAQIRVAASGASLLYGPNTLGGAINLVSRKPVRAFEGDASAGLASGGETRAAINLGGNQGSWYYQIGASYLDADSFPLPRGFQDYKAKPTDTGSRRENAYRTDQRLSLKLGITPNATDEYALGYVRQDGEKGNPVYTGQSRSGIRYWRWPYWDTDNLYFTSRTRLGESNLLKTRVYRSTYGNSINAFTDASYSAQLNNTGFPSAYDDSSTGASVELANYTVAGHELQLALHYKEDKHRETNPSSPTKDYRDVTTSIALEDSIALAKAWKLRLGLSHDQRDARQVYAWPTGSTSATNALAELSHALDEQGSEAYGVLSHKTRFPTIKDRYSARMGPAQPEPQARGGQPPGTGPQGRALGGRQGPGRRVLQPHRRSDAKRVRARAAGHLRQRRHHLRADAERGPGAPRGAGAVAAADLRQPLDAGRRLHLPGAAQPERCPRAADRHAAPPPVCVAAMGARQPMEAAGHARSGAGPHRGVQRIGPDDLPRPRRFWHCRPQGPVDSAPGRDGGFRREQLGRQVV
jgi:iron complex outermembrane receptor protein